MSDQTLEPLVDEGGLKAYLDEHLPLDPDTKPMLALERHQAGHSNETFFITWGDDEYVLRRPPRGAFLPTAHDVIREHRVLHALDDADVRTPRTVLACEDDAVIGAPFYLMERVHGRVIRTEVPAPLDTPDERRRIGEELVDALVELHAVDPDQVGLGDLGKTEGYIERQIERWTGQLELTQPRTKASRDVPELREIGDWLRANLPDSPPGTIVHGDYKLDNVAYAPDAPATLVGIYDWEMATLGDPFADVGWMLSFWADPDTDHEDLLTPMQSITEADGFPSRVEMLERYQDRSGRSMQDLDFYLVLAHWKLAILLEGSYARHLAGKTDDPFFELMEEGVPALAARAMALTER